MHQRRGHAGETWFHPRERAGERRSRRGESSLAGVRAFAHDVFTYPLPDGHRFPLGKYRLVREGAEASPAIDVADARAATDAELGLAHRPEYLRRVAAGELTRREVLELGLPWSPELV